jgi:hypothetical protein
VWHVPSPYGPTRAKFADQPFCKIEATSFREGQSDRAALDLATDEHVFDPVRVFDHVDDLRKSSVKIIGIFRDALSVIIHRLW